MNYNKKLASTFLLLCVLGMASTQCGGCSIVNGGQGIEALEQMTELEFNKWKLYIQLGVKIGANRLLEEHAVKASELELAAATLETIRDQTLIPGAESFIKDALKESGLQNDEVELLLIIVEQELLSRGALGWINPETNVVELSPRSKEVLTIVAEALRSALLVPVTDQDVQQSRVLQGEFNGKLIQ